MIKKFIIYSEYCDYRFKILHAEGSYIWDSSGKKYIDFTSGWNVTNLGWNNKEIAEAIKDQACKNVFVPIWCADDIQERYAQKLLAVMPPSIDTCIKTTGGTEAVEVSIKVARAATGRKKIIGFKNSYHGQLFASMALGFPSSLTSAISPLVPQFIQIDFPKNQEGVNVFKKFLTYLEGILKNNDVAAILTEANMITGWGSVFVAPEEYLKSIKSLASKYGTLLIVDEVGTGFSRTGKLFAIEHEGITPDLVCLAKGMSNGGSAIGAVVANSKLIEPVIGSTNLISTFGWTPIACAAALKTLEIHQRDRIWERAEYMGKYILKELRLRLLNSSKILDIRGVGMEIGIEFLPNMSRYKNIMSMATKNGLHLIGDNESTIQIMPPLTISQDDLEKGLGILVKAMLL